MRIDAHHHLWKYNPERDSWITDEMKILQNDFLPPQLKSVLDENKIDGSVLIQSEQSLNGNEFMLQLAKENSIIKGIVAWVDFQSENLEEQLIVYHKIPIIKGFRHILQSEKNRAFMLQPDFLKGIKRLQKYDYPYDILIFNDQLKFIPEFLKQFPNQRFVLDHMAKPDIKNKTISMWKKEMQSVSIYPNLYCKVSGMFTEADWHNWKTSDFTPYLDVVLESFGPKRLMYGSDWPVCRLAVDYRGQLSLAENYFGALSESENKLIFGGNALKFYNLT